MATINNIVTTDPDVLGGTPIFRGTRVAVRTLFYYLEETSLDDFLMGFPSVSREQAEAVIEIAAELFNDTTAQYEGTAASAVRSMKMLISGFNSPLMEAVTKSLRRSTWAGKV